LIFRSRIAAGVVVGDRTQCRLRTAGIIGEQAGAAAALTRFVLGDWWSPR
jgi:hypothetical protein